MASPDNPILAYLHQENLNQSRLAEIMGVAPSLVSDWINDRRHPSLANAFALERVTDGAIPASSWADRELRRAS